MCPAPLPVKQNYQIISVKAIYLTEKFVEKNPPCTGMFYGNFGTNKEWDWIYIASSLWYVEKWRLFKASCEG